MASTGSAKLRKTAIRTALLCRNHCGRRIAVRWNDRAGDAAAFLSVWHAQRALYCDRSASRHGASTPPLARSPPATRACSVHGAPPDDARVGRAVRQPPFDARPRPTGSWPPPCRRIGGAPPQRPPSWRVGAPPAAGYGRGMPGVVRVGRGCGSRGWARSAAVTGGAAGPTAGCPLPPPSVYRRRSVWLSTLFGRSPRPVIVSAFSGRRSQAPHAPSPRCPPAATDRDGGTRAAATIPTASVGCSLPLPYLFPTAPHLTRLPAHLAARPPRLCRRPPCRLCATQPPPSPPRA